MEQRTVNYALRVLDQQLEHMLKARTETQEAYYLGMLLMFDILISDGFKDNAHVQRQDDGTHRVINE